MKEVVSPPSSVIKLTAEEKKERRKKQRDAISRLSQHTESSRAKSRNDSSPKRKIKVHVTPAPVKLKVVPKIAKKAKPALQAP